MKFSIITITYNRGHLIGDTIQSVLNQTYQNFEHIIVDDGSIDNTQKVVESFNDDRIKYIKSERVGNLSKLTNIGFKLAKGQFISILDSDDLWHPEKLEIISELFRCNNSIQYVTHNIQYFYDPNTLRSSYYNFDDFFKNCIDGVVLFKILPFPICVFKKSLLSEIGSFNETYFDGQQDFLLRVASSYKIYYISKSLTFMRLHTTNTSNYKYFHYYKAYYISLFQLLKENKISTFLFFQGYFKITLNLIKNKIRDIFS